MEQFYEYQDNSKQLKDMIQTIEDEINIYKKVNYRGFLFYLIVFLLKGGI